jgi:transcriptional regulator with XRE-family HTH domain
MIKKALSAACQNVVYCLDHLSPFKGMSRGDQAAKLGIVESTITRWINGTSNPRPENLRRVAEVVGITDWRVLALPHEEFVHFAKTLNQRVDPDLVKPLVQLGSIEKHKHLWSDCARRLTGTYILYTRMLTDPIRVAKSLLRVIEENERGIRFDLYNVDDTYRRPRVYKYDGLLFPIFGAVIFIADEASHDEAFAMVTNFPQLIPPPYLVGYMWAVGVNKEIRKPTGSKAVAAFRSSTLIEVDRIRSELGLFKREEVNQEVAEVLFDEKPHTIP